MLYLHLDICLPQPEFPYLIFCIFCCTHLDHKTLEEEDPNLENDAEQDLVVNPNHVGGGEVQRCQMKLRAGRQTESKIPQNLSFHRQIFKK